MVPVHEMLSRIRWDRSYGKGKFTVGYYDRSEHDIVFVPFDEINFRKGDHFSFDILNEKGETCTIPFHRVKRIYRDGKVIWQRD